LGEEGLLEFDIYLHGEGYSAVGEVGEEELHGSRGTVVQLVLLQQEVLSYWQTPSTKYISWDVSIDRATICWFAIADVADSRDSDKECNESGTGNVPQRKRRAEQPESQVYSPFGGNLDTGRGPQTAGGSTGHWPESATRDPKGLVPGNGTVLPLCKSGRVTTAFPKREFSGLSLKAWYNYQIW
ncbi:hypothetical protein T10_5226, partial [Trichinella papuae]